jgi:hypothetical protein
VRDTNPRIGREKAMTDYSRMSYQELCTIANNDVLADSMSDEEYEKLSRELWKKFRVEKRITAMHPDFARQDSANAELTQRPISESVMNAPLGKHVAAMK